MVQEIRWRWYLFVLVRQLSNTEGATEKETRYGKKVAPKPMWGLGVWKEMAPLWHETLSIVEIGGWSNRAKYAVVAEGFPNVVGNDLIITCLLSTPARRIAKGFLPSCHHLHCGWRGSCLLLAYSDHHKERSVEWRTNPLSASSEMVRGGWPTNDDENGVRNLKPYRRQSQQAIVLERGENWRTDVIWL